MAPTARTTVPALACLAILALAGCNPPPPPPVVETTAVKAVDTPPPAYPLELACDGISGTVELMITVGPEGTVLNPRVQRSSGSPALDAVALESVRDWRFRAATRGGQPVSTEVAVPMTFNPPPEEPADCYYLQSGREPPSAG